MCCSVSWEKQGQWVKGENVEGTQLERATKKNSIKLIIGVACSMMCYLLKFPPGACLLCSGIGRFRHRHTCSCIYSFFKEEFIKYNMTSTF